MRLRKVSEKVEPLNDAEREWVASNVAEAERLVTASGLHAEGTLSPKALDDLWALLLSEEPDDPNPVINLVGLAFGQLLADRLEMSWVALTDKHGTEIAVRGPANFTVFPTNFVAKRYEERETGFLASAYNEMVRTAEALD
jgi:hypothetical protein